MTTSSAAYLTELHHLLNQHFNLAEIEDLCLRLHIDYESVPGNEKPSRIRALLLGLGRNGRLPDLIPLAQKLRPRVNWPPLPDGFELPESLAGETAVPSNQYHIYGDMVYGDMVHGDKIGRDKIVYQGLSPAEAAELVVQLKRKEQPKVWDGRTIPYLGLQSFQERDARFFFGRESLVDELLERVKSARFIAIAGPSGSGKSSVARAGLFPALRAGRLDKSDGWLLAAMQPKGDPIGQLAAAIDRMAGKPGAGDYLREHGRSNPLALHEQIEPLLNDDPRQRCILLVDQFEETFTQSKEADRAPFIALLTSAAEAADGRVTVILSLRADFVSHCARYPALRALMSQQFQLVGAMAPPDLAKAITRPALEVGAKIDPELVSRIIADMKGEPGTLPLMSFALRDLFVAEKGAKGEPLALTLPAYLERGGIERALERHANKVFAGFTDEEKALARGVFSKLIEVGQGRADTRRTAVFSELIPAGTEPETVEKVIRTLAEEGVRLVTTDGDGEERTVTLAHEKLIDAWPWLRQLVDENREMIALQNQINDDAAAWDKSKDAGYLYRGGRLIQVEERLEALSPVLTALSQAFIQASLEQRRKEKEAEEAQRRRELEQALALAEEQRQRAEAEQKRSALFRRALIGGGVLILFLVAAVIFAGIQRNTALEQAAVAQSRFLASVSLETGRRNDMGALLLAAAAGQEAETTLAFTALYTQLPFMPPPRQTFAHEDAVDGAAWNGDESQILTWSGDWDSPNGMAVLWDAASGARRQTFAHENVVLGAAWNGDESRILTWSRDGTAVLWDAASGERRQTFAHEGAVLGAAWNGDESRILTWSSDGTAKVWDTQTGQLRLVISPDGTRITAAQWNQAGDRLLVTTAGGVARIYDPDMDRLLDAACQAATRNFTWAEWQLYFPGEPYRPICPELPVHPSVPQASASP